MIEVKQNAKNQAHLISLVIIKLNLYAKLMRLKFQVCLCIRVCVCVHVCAYDKDIYVVLGQRILSFLVSTWNYGTLRFTTKYLTMAEVLKSNRTRTCSWLEN